MIRIVDTRLVVEKPVTHRKYYPEVIAITTQDSYPFAVSGATVDVVSNIPPNSSGYAAPLQFDDIIRIQVAVKYSRFAQTVWQDLFHGRIESMSSEYGTSNQLKLYCVGHEAELRTDLIEESIPATSGGSKPYTEPVDAKTLLSYFSKYFSRITYSASYASTGVSFPTYDTQKDQTFLTNLIGDMEKNSGFKWMFRVLPTYDASQNLSTVYASWQQFATAGSFTASPVKTYKIIEGTQRLIKASFDSEGEDVVTFQRVYGGTDTAADPDVQYTGSATSATLENLYGKRSAVDTYDWILSNNLCGTIATGLLAGEKAPVVSGQVELVLTPEAQVGDYVYLKIPSVELNSTSVDGYYYVMRVQHNINRSTCNTVLDLGRIQKSAEDYMGQVSKVVRKLKCEKVRKCA